MAKTIAQLMITGISSSSVEELKKALTIQDFEVIMLLIKERTGVEIAFEIEDIQLIEAEEI